jgi:3-deoxy-D-manno-octulosonic-acid transferase
MIPSRRTPLFSTFLALYRGLGWLLKPAIGGYLRLRLKSGKEDAGRLDERFGRPSAERSEGPLLWLHAASVGESRSGLPLLKRLLAERPWLRAVVTTGTLTSARLMTGELPARAVHQFLPLDLAAASAGFLDYWRPALVLWLESEFWPNILAEIGSRNIPAVLVNGRISPASFRRWRHFRFLSRALLGSFRLCLAQSARDAAYLRALGAPNVRYLGNLKEGAPPLSADVEELTRLDTLVGPRPRWVAASTHAGEEEIASKVHKRLKLRLPELLTIVVPRHPERGAELASRFRAEGIKAGLRSEKGVPGRETEFYIADTIGELGLWFRLADIAFIGGSLVARGGQNPLEPARLGCAILHGPHMGNFAEVIADLDQAGAAKRVEDGAGLGRALEELLNDHAARANLAEKARTFVADGETVLDEVTRAIAPLADSLAPSAHSPAAWKPARAAQSQ